MADKAYIKELLIKFARNQCSREEEERLLHYFRGNPSMENFPDLPDVLPFLEAGGDIMDSQKADRVFHNILDKRPINRKRKFTILKYAATFALILGSAYTIYLVTLIPTARDTKPNTVETLPISASDVRKEAITLQLPNGQIKVLSDTGTSKVMDKAGKIVGQQKNDQLIYSRDNGSHELVYNTLTVPYGKKFELLLSDGTSAILNAGSSLRYPVQFDPDTERRVYLSGEAFFDVAKDFHRAFVIEAEDLNIKVYGTKFNVSSYAEDEVTDVVLVEGSVGLYRDAGEFVEEKVSFLTPGHKGSYEKKGKYISTEAVSIEGYTAWMNGELVFRNMSFNNILKKLERHYNVVITNKNATLGEELFNARFRKVSIAKVLGYFGATYGLKYEIDGKEIIIQ